MFYKNHETSMHKTSQLKSKQTIIYKYKKVFLNVQAYY